MSTTSHVNSALVAFLKSTPSKQLTLIDLYEKKEMVDVYTNFMETVSDFFKTFSRYDIPLQVPVNVNVAKSLIEFVQGVNNKLDDDSLDSYYKLAVIWNIKIVKDSCLEKIKEISPQNVMKFYDNSDINDEFKNALVKNMMSHLDLFNDSTIVGSIKFPLLEELLTREDYETDYTNLSGVGLEDQLINLMITWFGSNLSETTEENGKTFLKCWKLIHKDTLSPTGFSKVMETSYYKNIITVKQEIGPEIAQELMDIMHLKPSGKQRNVLYLEKTTKDKMLLKDAIEKLKVGDALDIMDKQKMWYIGDILQPATGTGVGTDKKLKVHFHGWDKKYDEFIFSYESRFAPMGTFTNGIKHDDSKGENCDCNACNAQTGFKCNDPYCLICAQGGSHPKNKMSNQGSIPITLPNQLNPQTPFASLFNTLL